MTLLAICGVNDAAIANDRLESVVQHEKYSCKNADASYTYIKRPERALRVFVWAPPKPVTKPAPAVVLYHGGGWNGGSTNSLSRSAKYLSTAGYYTIVPEYRIKNKDKTTPFEAVADAEAAMQWIIDHTGEPGMEWDKKRIALMGSSAGSHLAMVTGLSNRVESLKNGDAKIFAFALFNSVYDGSPNGYGKGRLGTTPNEYEPYSPLHLIRSDMPPIQFTHGKKDEIIPYAKAIEFKKRLDELGVEHNFLSYDKYTHNTGPYFSKSSWGLRRWKEGIQNVEKYLNEKLPKPSEQ
ncbi:alpha/beta hydrolase [Poriferisphaera corsica]|uniref:alpha/beta hydrolase n=1 Tax=Poriferisphaera corsica TaxID=2528020 RepID=UPI00190A1D14|nr:alpha/beta hydrolase [Poriferisphaera corsica]